MGTVLRIGASGASRLCPTLSTGPAPETASTQPTAFTARWGQEATSTACKNVPATSTEEVSSTAQESASARIPPTVVVQESPLATSHTFLPPTFSTVIPPAIVATETHHSSFRPRRCKPEMHNCEQTGCESTLSDTALSTNPAAVTRSCPAVLFTRKTSHLRS